MKSTPLIILSAVGIATVVGALIARPNKSIKPSSATSSTSESLLAGMPSGTGSSYSDATIAKAIARCKKEPNAANAWCDLGDTLMQKARETADVTYYSTSEKIYSHALELDPKTAYGMAGMAWVYGGRHEFAKSIEWANKAIAANPGVVAPYGIIGDAQVELGDYDAAYISYQKMMDLKPDTSSYARGGHLVFLNGDSRKGMMLMQRAVQMGGPYTENTAWCAAQLGMMAFSTGNSRAAGQILELAEKQAPNNFHVNLGMGKIKAGLGKSEDAIVYLKKAVAAAPQVEALIALGEVYESVGNQAEADKCYAQLEAVRAIQKANGVQGDRLTAKFYADHDRNLPEALKMAEEEYARFKNVYSADTLAWCQYKNGRFAEAKLTIKEAVKRKTPEASFLYHAGMIEAKLGQNSAAQLKLYQAMSMNPHFSLIDSKLAAAEIKQLGTRHTEVVYK